MNREDELVNELLATQIELGEVKGQLLIAEKQVSDAKIAVAGYLAELERVAKSTQEMLKGVASIQTSADKVRVRLGKVQMALRVADDYINTLIRCRDLPKAMCEVELERADETYRDSKEMLKTPDVLTG